MSAEDAILAYNAGSSSIKFAVFPQQAGGKRLLAGEIREIGGPQATFATHGPGTGTTHRPVAANDHGQALHAVLDFLAHGMAGRRLTAAGHRVVHGGAEFDRPVRIDATVQARMQALVPLAPLHQPHALQAIAALTQRYPELTQVACFDTAFHAHMPRREQRLPVPKAWERQGIRRYGFHGLSYESIVDALPAHLGEAADGRVVIAHLGHGVSMCAVKNRQSIATTMGYTPLDGLPMGRRSGAIDPAVVLQLLEGGMAASEISDALHRHSGLLGLSGISDDMHTLLESGKPAATEAIEIFCYRIARELGSLAAALGGLDAVVFTGGIGMHAAPVRERICRDGAWLGIAIDAEANRSNALCISKPASPVSVWAMPTDEEQIIARHTLAVLSAGERSAP